jgi:hypothetical protein
MKWRRLRLFESAKGGRVSQRPIILSSAGNPPEADKLLAVFSLVRFFVQAKK